MYIFVPIVHQKQPPHRPNGRRAVSETINSIFNHY